MITEVASALTFGLELEVVGPEDITEAVAREVFGTISCVAQNDEWTTYCHPPELLIEGPLGLWRSVRESSIEPMGDLRCGREFVSPVLRVGSAEDHEKVAGMLAALQRAGCAVNDTCGLHVHVGAKDRARDPVFILSALALSFEWSRLIHALLRDARLESTFCEAHTRWFMAAVAPFFTGAKPATWRRVMRVVCERDPRTVKLDTDKLELPRNYGVNLTALPRHGTVEYRFFEGTLDAALVRAYVDLVSRFTAAVMVTEPALHPARAPTEANAEMFLDWLGVNDATRAVFLTPETREYLRWLERGPTVNHPTLDLSLLDAESRRLAERVLACCSAASTSC